MYLPGCGENPVKLVTVTVVSWYTHHTTSPKGMWHRGTPTTPLHPRECGIVVHQPHHVVHQPHHVVHQPHHVVHQPHHFTQGNVASWYTNHTTSPKGMWHRGTPTTPRGTPTTPRGTPTTPLHPRECGIVVHQPHHFTQGNVASWYANHTTWYTNHTTWYTNHTTSPKGMWHRGTPTTPLHPRECGIVVHQPHHFTQGNVPSWYTNHTTLPKGMWHVGVPTIPLNQREKKTRRVISTDPHDTPMDRKSVMSYKISTNPLSLVQCFFPKLLSHTQRLLAKTQYKRQYMVKNKLNIMIVVLVGISANILDGLR